MKRKTKDGGLSGPSKRRVVDSAQLQKLIIRDEEIQAQHLSELDPSASQELEDDAESVITEANRSVTSTTSIEPPAQTAATSIALSTTSRAGRKFPSDLKTIPCPEPGCGKTFNRPARLTAHLRSHRNDRPFKCTERGCDKSYMEEKHLRQHIKGSHTQERKYQCEEPGCGKFFLTGTRLRRHAAVHEGANRFRCLGYGECSQSFRKHQTLQRHIRTAHLGQKPYICGADGCKEDFDSPNALKRHVEREHGELRFWCDECTGAEGENSGKLGFTTLHLLQAHVRETHVGCPFCDVKCSGQWALEKHIDDFHSGKTVEDRKTIACTWEGCPKKFVKMSNLNAHVKTAHEGYRLVCGQVDTFGWSDAISNWNWIEEGCGDTFISKMKLEEHIRFVHLGMKRPPVLCPDPLGQNDVISDLSGVDDFSKRNISCTVAGCAAMFIRYHDLGVHMQKMHKSTYGEQHTHTLATAIHSDDGPCSSPTEPLVPVDPQLQSTDEFNFGTEVPEDVFWFGGEFPDEQIEDFEQDLVDMRLLIDVDALVDRPEKNG